MGPASQNSKKSAPSLSNFQYKYEEQQDGLQDGLKNDTLDEEEEESQDFIFDQEAFEKGEFMFFESPIELSSGVYSDDIMKLNHEFSTIQTSCDFRVMEIRDNSIFDHGSCYQKFVLVNKVL